MTVGKIERSLLTYDLEDAGFPLHRKLIEYYNHEHPHMTLDYSTLAGSTSEVCRMSWDNTVSFN
jgi:transposase InsO family protein